MTQSSVTILQKDSAQLELSTNNKEQFLLTCLEDGLYNSIDIYLSKKELIQFASNILNTVKFLSENNG